MIQWVKVSVSQIWELGLDSHHPTGEWAIAAFVPINQDLRKVGRIEESPEF